MWIGVGAFCAAIVPGPTGKKGWIQSQDDRQKLGRTRRFVGASVGIGSYSQMVARNVSHYWHHLCRRLLGGAGPLLPKARLGVSSSVLHFAVTTEKLLLLGAEAGGRARIRKGKGTTTTQRCFGQSLPSESLQAGPLLEEKLPDEGDAIVMHFKNPFDVGLSMWGGTVAKVPILTCCCT